MTASVFRKVFSVCLVTVTMTVVMGRPVIRTPPPSKHNTRFLVDKP